MIFYFKQMLIMGFGQYTLNTTIHICRNFINLTLLAGASFFSIGTNKMIRLITFFVLSFLSHTERKEREKSKVQKLTYCYSPKIC